MMSFDELLQLERGNAWVTEPGFAHLYARIGLRVIDGGFQRAIDLANFEVKDKGQGVFTRFIKKIEQHQLPIFVESVMNERLAKYLPKLGFVQVENSIPPTFLKLGA